MNGYVLITHGPRHAISDLFTHPGAKRQARNLKVFHERRIKLEAPGSRLRILSDYCRKPQTPDDIPRLLSFLQKLAALDQRGAVFIDDFTGLVGRFPESNRQGILAALDPFGDHLYGIGQKKFLSDFSPEDRARLLITEPHNPVFAGSRRALPPEERKSQTANAVRVSKRVRSARSDAKAAELRALRDELIAANPGLTFKDLADAANSRGITTTRGNEWTRSTVSQLLRKANSGVTLLDE